MEKYKAKNQKRLKIMTEFTKGRRNYSQKNTNTEYLNKMLFCFFFK